MSFLSIRDTDVCVPGRHEYHFTWSLGFMTRITQRVSSSNWIFSLHTIVSTIHTGLIQSFLTSMDVHYKTEAEGFILVWGYLELLAVVSDTVEPLHMSPGYRCPQLFGVS